MEITLGERYNIREKPIVIPYTCSIFTMVLYYSVLYTDEYVQQPI